MFEPTNLFEEKITEVDDDDSSLSSMHTPATVQRKAETMTPGQWIMNSQNAHDTGVTSDRGPDSELNSVISGQRLPNDLMSRSSMGNSKAVGAGAAFSNSSVSDEAPPFRVERAGSTASQQRSAYEEDQGGAQSLRSGSSLVHSVSPSALDANVRSLSHHRSISPSDGCQGVQTPRASARGLPDGSPMWARAHLEETGNVNVIEDELIKPQLLKAPSRLKSFMSAERNKLEDSSPYMVSGLPSEAGAGSLSSSAASKRMAQQVTPYSKSSRKGFGSNYQPPCGSPGGYADSRADYAPDASLRPDAPVSNRFPAAERRSEEFDAHQRELRERLARQDHEIENMSRELAMLRVAHQELQERDSALKPGLERRYLELEARQRELAERQRVTAAESAQEAREQLAQEQVEAFESRLTHFEQVLEQRESSLAVKQAELTKGTEELESLEEEIAKLTAESKNLATSVAEQEAELLREQQLVSEQLVQKSARIQKQRDLEASRVTFVPLIGDCAQPIAASERLGPQASQQPAGVVLAAPCLLSHIPPR